MDISKKRGFPFYPRWVEYPDGVKRLVQDHTRHGEAIGKKVLEDATIVEPPSLQEVIDAGYAPDVAEKIVAQEKAKFDKGYKPYGDLEPPVAGEPAAEVVPQEPSKTWD